MEPVVILAPTDSKPEASVPMFNVPTTTTLRTMDDKTYQSINRSPTNTKLEEEDETGS